MPIEDIYWPDGFLPNVWPDYWPCGAADVLVATLLLMRWSGGTETRYFFPLQEGYAGEKQQVPRKAERSFDDGVVRVRQESTAFRGFDAILRVMGAPTSVRIVRGVAVSEGSWEDLLEAYGADDLELWTYFDSDFWPCVMMGEMVAMPQWDPMLIYAAVSVKIVGIGG
jgi:hypothetical protein